MRLAIKSLLLLVLLVNLCGFQSSQSIHKSSSENSVIYADTTKIDSSSVILKPYKEKVHASHYHDNLNGNRTASGEKFDNESYTAAHRTLKFGTKLKITNTVNGCSVIVTVNDRGPFVKGRELDLSKRAFMDIAKYKQRGYLIVNIEIIED